MFQVIIYATEDGNIQLEKYKPIAILFGCVVAKHHLKY